MAGVGGTNTDLGYQNPPVETDALLDTTLIAPVDNQTGLPIVRENVVAYQTSELRNIQEMSLLQNHDRFTQGLVKYGKEKTSMIDRRGGIGRGSSR